MTSVRYPRMECYATQLGLWGRVRGECGILQLPQSTLILNIRGSFEEKPLRKIVGPPWKEGEIRLEVDK